MDSLGEESGDAYIEPVDEERILVHQVEASRAHARAEREWEEISKRGPVRIMVAGLGGTGKSTLVNRLFGPGLEESDSAKEGCSGKATTRAVQRYHHKLKNGVEAIIFDTPGFDDPNINEHRIVADMELTAEENVHLLLYCVSLASPGARVTQGDARVLCLLTNVFNSSLWNNAIFVVTFANFACMWTKSQEHYMDVTKTIREELRAQLKSKARVPENVASEIPLVTAGHTELVIEYEQEDWVGKLYGKLLERNTEIATALLKGKMNTKEKFVELIVATLATSTGTGVGVGIGAGLGALGGALGGPIGIPIGVAIGSAIGGGILLILGASASAGTLMWRRKRFKDRIEVARELKEIKKEMKKANREGEK